MDAVSQSQSPRKDARTRLKEERINLEIDEQIEYEQRRDAYPEPEGDPSY